MSQEIEIGLGKKGRLAYSLDDVSIVPSRRTRDPQDVSTSWQVDAYEFDVPVIGAPMDSVTSPATAIAMGKMGALGVLDLEGLWTRYDDPQPLLDEIAELRPKARPSVFSRSTPSRSSRSSLSSVCMRFVTPASPLRAPCPRSARRTIIRPCSKRASTCSSSAARSFPPSTSPRITSH